MGPSFRFFVSGGKTDVGERNLNCGNIVWGGGVGNSSQCSSLVFGLGLPGQMAIASDGNC